MDLEKAYDKIYRYAYFRVKNVTLAEDITQETFLRFFGKSGTFHENDMKYLYTIARNLCIDEYRRVKPDEPLEEGALNEPSVDFPEESIIVRDALEKLTDEDREILLLRYVNEEPVGTICRALGISRFALYRKIKNAEEELKKNLKEDE
ncbi:MAG: RNA polymerase sigma factor [Lachnospiraceae bacterium]|nr:RNA polymerase sigma factor [Lachnospiraceae bacterium]